LKFGNSSLFIWKSIIAFVPLLIDDKFYESFK